MPTIEEDGWTLLSGEERQREHSEFSLPSGEARSGLSAGDAVQLLFDIETREHGRVIDRGIDRMWVIVRSSHHGRYSGLLDSEPGMSEGLQLCPGHEIEFGPEHIIKIERPPREYVIEKYGASFFDSEDAG